MLTQTFQVFNLRGMDERWLTEANNALYIQDMSWVSNDSWRTAGGWHPYFQQSPYYALKTTTTTTEEVTEYHAFGDPEEKEQYLSEKNHKYSPPPITITTTVETVTVDDVQEIFYPVVKSIHWFAQHNGARQFLVYEQQSWDPDDQAIDPNRLELRYFDGSRSKWEYSTSADKEPSRLMVAFDKRRSNTNADADIGRGLRAISDRYDAGLVVPTQAQAWSNRLYLVNGHQAPLVFNGEYAEKAGFQSAPEAPEVSACDWMDSATYCYAIGNNDDLKTEDPQKRKGMYGLFGELRHFGMGPKSFAKFGTGKYRTYAFSRAHAESFDLSTLGPPTPTSVKEAIALGRVIMDHGGEVLHNSDENIKTHLRLNEQYDSRPVGWQYKVTYVNERGQESEPSPASSVVKFRNGSAGKNQHGQGLVAVTIPRGPSECVARRIYRTRNLYNSKGSMVLKGASKRYYFLKEIEDNMTSRMVDGHPDSSLGGLLSTRNVGSYPGGTRFISSFKNTMFVAGTTNNTVRFSKPNFPEMFPERFSIDIGDSDGSPITGMRATKNALVVFKSRGIYLIKGDPRSGFYAETLNRDVGCWAPNSIAELPGLGLVFLSDKDIYLLEGALENTGTATKIVKLSTEIPGQMELINTSASLKAIGSVYLKDNEYWLSVPTHGSRKNNRLLVYHYLVGSWSMRENYPISCAAHSNDHRGYLFFGVDRLDTDPEDGFETTAYDDFADRSGLPGAQNKGIAVYSKGYPMKGETFKVDPFYRTANLPFGSVYSSVQPAHVFVYGVGYGNNDMGLNYRVNRSLYDVRDAKQPADQQDPNERYSVYGKAQWDVDNWGEYRPTVIRYDISTTHKGPARELGITFAIAEDAPSGTKIEIVGYDIEAKVGEQRKIKPLNEALRPDRR